MNVNNTGWTDQQIAKLVGNDPRVQFKPLIGKQFEVLDHGIIEVVDYMGDDYAIAQAARTSYGKATKKVSTDQGLINYLWRNEHGTPFEMCELKVFMRLPIFVARQLIRHRTASVNEYSMRYSEPQDLFYCPELDQITFQATDNKQGRSKETDVYVAESFQEATKQQALDSMQLYKDYNDDAERRVARELNRINLPVSLYTQWYWKCDLRNLLGFLKLRMDSHAQYEIRVFANALAEVVKEAYPMAWAAFEEYTLHAIRLSRKEQKVVKAFMESFSLPDAEDSTLYETCGFNKREWEELRVKFKRIGQAY